MQNNVMQEKMVPAEVLRELTRGSYEHLAYRVKSAIEENKKLFVSESDVSVDSLATFNGYVLVGTDDGRYFRSKFEDVDGNIKLLLPEMLDVPLVQKKNAQDYIRDYALATVDSLLAGRQEEAVDRILALSELTEAVEEGIADLASAVLHHVSESRLWRRILHEQKSAILEQIKDDVEGLVSRVLETKYVPLYDGTIPEEKFENYRDMVTADLNVVSDRLEKTQMAAEMAYYPFAEAIAKMTRSSEEDQVLKQFADFSEDFFHDIESLREHVAFGLKNEQCVMCLGQVHDSMTEALTDYEIAGSFIERMVNRFTSADSK